MAVVYGILLFLRLGERPQTPLSFEVLTESEVIEQSLFDESLFDKIPLSFVATNLAAITISLWLGRKFASVLCT